MSYSRHSKHPVTGKYLTAVEYNELADKHGWEKIPDWEAELRDRLERTLTSGAYQIGGPGMIAWTGKGGKIEYEVALARTIRGLCLPEPELVVRELGERKVYKKLTYAELEKKIGDALFGDFHPDTEI